jgi:hypothetical protein
LAEVDKEAPAAAPINRPSYALVALALSTIFVISVPVAAWVYYSQGPGVDFVSFWAAGRLALSGHPELAYDIDTHRALERTVVQIGGLMPFPYPPPFLLAVALFAIAPYWLAYLLWIAVTAALYLAATRSALPPRFAFAHPAALVNSVIGQNGFLTSAIFIAGISIIASQPFAGGLVLGLLVIKPQLGILLPVALLADRNWKAIAGAALSSLMLLVLAALVFGLDSYRAFAGTSQQYAVFMESYAWDWGEQASVFAFFRFFGIPQAIALTAQIVAALGAAVVTWRAWASGHPQRAAILAAATILVPPYLFTYDSLILVLPMASLLRDPERAWRPATVWLLLFLPLIPLFGFEHAYPGPNTIPIAAILCLWWLSATARSTERAAATG